MLVAGYVKCLGGLLRRDDIGALNERNEHRPIVERTPNSIMIPLR